ncbi:MAG: ferrous iron transport protein A [Clostridiaceae bacterium]|nr:ferrous iron transport protein A [Clostridiaceae bacterium]
MEPLETKLTLSDIPNGKSAVITEVIAEDGMRRRLQDLGFIVGNNVDSLNTAAIGDLTAYRINGTVIAIRKDDTDNILVEEINV